MRLKRSLCWDPSQMPPDYMTPACITNCKCSYMETNHIPDYKKKKSFKLLTSHLTSQVTNRRKTLFFCAHFANINMLLRVLYIIYSVIATIQNPVQFDFIVKLVIIPLNQTTPQKQHFFHLVSSICCACCRKALAYNK